MVTGVKSQESAPSAWRMPASPSETALDKVTGTRNRKRRPEVGTARVRATWVCDETKAARCVGAGHFVRFDHAAQPLMDGTTPGLAHASSPTDRQTAKRPKPKAKRFGPNPSAGAGGAGGAGGHGCPLSIGFARDDVWEEEGKVLEVEGQRRENRK